MTDGELKIHSETAWDIASQWSWALASGTRTLAAQIDVALSEARATGRREGLSEAANVADAASKEWEADAALWHKEGMLKTAASSLMHSEGAAKVAAAIRAAMEKAAGDPPVGNKDIGERHGDHH